MPSKRPATVLALLLALALGSAGCSSPSVPQSEEVSLTRAARSFTISNHGSGPSR